ncbi:MAG: DUF871 family protein [Alkalibacterium sp.]|nr:DUF871 family protein [Alkalibacterium sp.]
MSKNLGFSVYVSQFDKQRQKLEKLKGQNYPVFTSLHMNEEMSSDYVTKVEAMCQWLTENDFNILADVSPVTIRKFGEESLLTLAKRLNLDNVRLDYGFDLDTIELGEALGVTFNASTVDSSRPKYPNALYMHNFYPRPETALDSEQLMQMNEAIRSTEGRLAAFITGDSELRGPLYEGLPTLENHRNQSPYGQYVDLVKNYGIEKVFVGDLLLSQKEIDRINAYIEDGIIRLPVQFSEEDDYLYNQPFTVRVDSPSKLIRVQESREYAQPGRKVMPTHTDERWKGTVTMDNEKYLRYSGEVQITKADYSADKRVNVIGKIDKYYHLLLDNLHNGDSFMFIKEE